MHGLRACLLGEDIGTDGLPGLLARAALEGVSLLEMPPAGLEELAALLGNQGMKELLERQALPVEEARLPPLFGVETVPFPVPEGSPPPTAPFPGPPAEEYGGRAFDPAALTE